MSTEIQTERAIERKFLERVDSILDEHRCLCGSLTNLTACDDCGGFWCADCERDHAVNHLLGTTFASSYGVYTR